jgi:hypothetical protein
MLLMPLSQSEKEKLRNLYLQHERHPYHEKRIYYPSWPIFNRQDRLKHSDYKELSEEDFISYNPWKRKTFLAKILIKGKKYIDRHQS